MCEHWLGTRSCAKTKGVRMFQVGPRCPSCTPAALAGRPDVVPDPEWGAEAGYVRSGWHKPSRTVTA